MKIIIDRENLVDVLDELTYNHIDGISKSSKIIGKLLKEHPLDDNSDIAIDEGSSILIYPPILDIVADIVDILSAYWWNIHTEESEHSARLIEPILLQLEEMRNENNNR